MKWAGHDLDPVVARTAATVENQNVPVDHDPEIGREVDDTDVIEIDTAGADIPLAQIPATPQDAVEKRWTDWQTGIVIGCRNGNISFGVQFVRNIN